jgi:hypothetical protein
MFKSHRIVSLIFLIACSILSCIFAFGAQVKLAWDPSPSVNAVGYRIYWGGNSAGYTNSVAVGNVTNTTVTNLINSRTYYFSATAYDSAGLESPFSNEASGIASNATVSNAPPVFVATPNNRTIGELTLLTVTNRATDIDTNTLTYSLVVAPTGAIISQSGVITWSPTESQGPNIYTISTSVSDGVASITNSFNVTVNEVNTPPAFVSNPINRTINEGDTITVTNKATDVDIPINLLSYSIVNPPAGMTISTGGVITWSPNSSQGTSTNVIRTVVTDGIASVTNSFNIVVNNVTASPTITSIPNQTLKMNSSSAKLSFTIADSDSNLTNLIVKAVANNPILLPTNSFLFVGSSSNRNLYVTPATNQVGAAVVTMTVTDESSNQGSSAFTVNVNNDTNRYVRLVYSLRYGTSLTNLTSTNINLMIFTNPPLNQIYTGNLIITNAGF